LVKIKKTGWTLKDRELLWDNSEAIKLFSMRGNPKVLMPVKNLALNETLVISYACLFTTYVRKPIARGQYAWVDKNFVSTHQGLNQEHPNNNQIYDHSKSVNKSKYTASGENKDNFHQWLVGFTDGDGSFSIIRVAERKWTLFFKISQSTYNLRVLYFIKKQLGVGSVHIEADYSKGDFRIRDRNIIGSVIIPIFDKYPLLTSRFYNYQKFKKAYEILINPNFSPKEKDSLLLELKSQKVTIDYISPAWEIINYKVNNTNDAKLVMSPANKDISPKISHLIKYSRVEDIKSIMSVYWLIGFVEAVGNFLIRRNSRLDDPNLYIFEFSIKKLDFLVLCLIKRILHVPNKVIYDEKEQSYNLTTRNSRAIKNIIDKFLKIQTRRCEIGKFKGVKSLIFKLWWKANQYKDKNPKKFLTLYKIMLKLITLNKTGLMCKLNHNNVVQPLCSNQEDVYLSREHKQIKISSHLNNFASLRVDCAQQRLFSSLSTITNSGTASKLDPWFVTGFADGESYFSISIVKSSRLKLGWTVFLQFGFNLHIKDKQLLERIQSYFAVGNISPGKTNCQFRVTSIKDLEIIIHHFDIYPLLSQKFSDYQLFRLAFELVKDKKHLTQEGLNKIVSIKSSMNLGLSDQLKLAFPNITAIPRPLGIDRVIKNPNWLAGFVDGEGCFNINIIKSETNKTGIQVKARFILTQHSRDLELMKNLIEFLGCGNLSEVTKPYIYLTISKLNDLYGKVIPLLNKYPLQGSKKLDFILFCEVVELMKNQAHLTAEGLEKIKILKARMNTDKIM
jgi:hypothetical protein